MFSIEDYVLCSDVSLHSKRGSAAAAGQYFFFLIEDACDVSSWRDEVVVS